MKIDASYYGELIHPELSNPIEDTANNQVIISPIESTHQKGKKGISYRKDKAQCYYPKGEY